jgi:hypothetical protein
MGRDAEADADADDADSGADGVAAVVGGDESICVFFV